MIRLMLVALLALASSMANADQLACETLPLSNAQFTHEKTAAGKFKLTLSFNAPISCWGQFSAIENNTYAHPQINTNIKSRLPSTAGTVTTSTTIKFLGRQPNWDRINVNGLYQDGVVTARSRNDGTSASFTSNGVRWCNAGWGRTNCGGSDIANFKVTYVAESTKVWTPGNYSLTVNVGRETNAHHFNDGTATRNITFSFNVPVQKCEITLPTSTFGNPVLHRNNNDWWIYGNVTTSTNGKIIWNKADTITISSNFSAGGLETFGNDLEWYVDVKVGSTTKTLSKDNTSVVFSRVNDTDTYSIKEYAFKSATGFKKMGETNFNLTFTCNN